MSSLPLHACAADAWLAQQVPERGCFVASLACAVPDAEVPNELIAQRLGVSADWIERRTGVQSRRFATDGERLCDLAASAAQQALRQAGLVGDDLDLILVATTQPDDILPNAAPLVGGEIGAQRAAAIDVGAACTGFISALALACAQLESGRSRTALVVGADLMSRLLDPDRATAALFGDAAGAVVLTAGDGVGSIGRFVFSCDADGADQVYARREDGHIVMSGHETFRAAVTCLAKLTVDCARGNGVKLDEIDLFVFHQANARILRAVGERLRLNPDRLVDAIGERGNTSAASIPLALGAAQVAGRLTGGSRLLLAAFRAGWTWGGTVLEWVDAKRPTAAATNGTLHATRVTNASRTSRGSAA